MKQRSVIGVSYDGSAFSGWQKQRHSPNTVQALVEAALSKVADHSVSIQCAGRTIELAEFLERSPFLCFKIRANAFLQHMVRNIMGSLIKVGRGEEDVNWFEAVLAGRDRRQAGMTAPPQGLHFTHVQYPAQYALPDSKDYQGFLSWFR